MKPRINPENDQSITWLKKRITFHQEHLKRAIRPWSKTHHENSIKYWTEKLKEAQLLQMIGAPNDTL